MTTSTDFSLTRQLAAYIPVTLTRRILEKGLPPVGTPHSLTAATLFADVSGFTAMSEELATDGPRGAEELNRALMLTFTGLVDVVHNMGGAIGHYYGDAMLVYFPDKDGLAAQRAVACAQMMQQLMEASLSRIVTNRPPGKDPIFDLTIKIGVGYGRCQEIIIGQPERSLEFVLTGPAVDDAAQAEQHAASSQIIASLTAVAQAGLMPQADYALFDQPPIPQPPATPILDWSAYDKAALARLGEAVLPFIPPALVERFATAGSLAEHRPVTNIFVQVDFAGDEDDSSAIETAERGQQLQSYYLWVVSVIDRFGGQNAHLSRVLTGDKGNQLHIIFGAPVAPDAPEQAVRCALALQTEQPDIIAAQRIGLTAGKVFAGPLGSPTRQEYATAGAVVNLAARLMQACPDGDVLLDKATADRIGRWLRVEPLPPVKMKGFQEPVTPYRAIGERAATQLENYLEQWARPLVGRDRELDLLQQGLDAAFSGSGRAAAIQGTTGVGKSHLLAAGMRSWLKKGGRGLLGVCFRHTTETPYAPWRAIWREMFGLTPGMSVSEQVTAVTEQTRALVPGSGDDTGLWQEALGLPIPQPETLSALTAEVRQTRFFTLVRRCFQALAEKQPLLIALEDLHWADQTSLKLLDDLSAHLDDTAVFLAFTFQPEESLTLETWQRPSCISIVLTDLSAVDGRTLLSQLSGVTTLPDTVERHLGLRDREGRDSPVNPLFLAEALQVMLEAGAVQVNGRVRVNEAQLAQMQVPDTIHGLLLARLDQLPPAGRDLLQVASVVGRQFALDPLQVVSGELSRPHILDLLTDLSQTEMTRLVTADPEWVYLFRHALTHEVAYESLPFARRQMLHALVADWLEEQYGDNLQPFYAMLAYHYGRAANQEKCLYFAIQAGDAARAIFANQEAVELYTLAQEQLLTLGEAERWDTAVHLYLARAAALMAMGDFATAVTDAERAAQHARAHNVPEQLAQAYNTLAELKWRQVKLDEVQELTATIIEQLAKHISAEELARAYYGAGWGAASSGHWDEALTQLNHAQQLSVANNDISRLALTLEAIAYVHFSQGNLENALEIMQQSIKYAYNTATPANVALSLSNIALIQFQLGRPENALHTYNDAVELATNTNQNILALTLGNRAEVLAYLGRIQDAHLDFVEAIDLFSTMNDEAMLLEAYLLKGHEYHIPLDEWENAAHWFDLAEKIISTRPDAYPEKKARLFIGLARTNIHTKSYAEASSYLSEAETIIREKELDWWLPVVLHFNGVVYKQAGSAALAQEQFMLSLAAIAQNGCPDYKPLTLLNVAQLTQNQAEQKRRLRECVTAARQRARLLDKIACLNAVSHLFTAMEDEELKQEGKNLKDEAQALQNQVQMPPSP
ncbi:MAG: AAA family ATPase [Chloroflexi bacterium]|nr:AAA family ATPase [Chloroflexota bacterium]